MTVTTARHRSARRPATPLSDFATAATGSIAVVGRRSAVAVAAAGLVVSAFAAPASAAPAPENAASVPVDTSALTSSARAALETAPAVTVAADASWTLDVLAVTVVVDAPKKRVAAAASRSTARTAAPAAPAAAAAATGVVPQSVAGNAVLEIAARYVGVPYRTGGKTPAGFDCSGFTSYVFAQLGHSIGGTSGAQRSAGTVVSRAAALPGDLIWTSGHVAIYAGGNQEIDSPKPGGSIQFRAIWQSSALFIRVG